MATTTAAGSLSQLIEQEFPIIRSENEPEVDPFFTRLLTTSEGVKRGIGTNFQVMHTYAPCGVAGSVKNVAAAGPPTTDLANTPQGVMWGTPRAFPTRSRITSPGTHQRTLTLVQMMGNLLVPYHYMLADVLDASIIETVGMIMRQTAKNVNQTEANGFYASDGTTKAIVKVLNTGCLTNNGSGNITFSFADSSYIAGRVAMLQDNMTVTAMDESATPDAALANGAVGIVHTVDYTAKTFNVYFPGGNVTFAANDYLVPADTEVNTGISGPDYWLTDSGTIWNIDLSVWRSHKSIVVANAACVLDEAFLTKYVGGFLEAYGKLYSLDSINGTTGILTMHLNSLDGLYRYERQGARLDLKEGWVAMDYSYAGERFTYAASRYQKPGRVWIMKMRDGNIKRYTPPRVKRTGSEGGFPTDVQFLAPAMGSTNNFLPLDESGVTEFAQAPFVWLREVAPIQIAGLKVDGLLEDNP